MADGTTGEGAGASGGREELDALLARMEVELGPGAGCDCEPALTKLEHWSGTWAESSPRYLLYRGLARYLRDRDDEGRSDYVRGLELVGEDARLEVELLTRVAQLDTFHGRFSEADLLLERAEAKAAAEGPRDILGAEVAFRRGLLAKSTQDPGPASAYLERAAELFERCGSPQRAFKSRLDAMRCHWTKDGPPTTTGPLDELVAAGRRLGLTDVAVGEAVLRVASEIAATVGDGSLMQWVEDHVGLLEGSMEAGLHNLVATTLLNDGRSDVARRLFARAVSASSPGDIRNALARLRLRTLDPHASPSEIVDAAHAAMSAGVEADVLIIASKLLMDRGATDDALELLASLREHPDASIQQQATLNTIGGLVICGRIDEAFELRRVTEFDFSDDDEFRGVLLLNDAVLHAARGLMNDALCLGEEALPLLRRAPDAAQLIAALGALALWSSQAGDVAAAGRYAEELAAMLPRLVAPLHGRARVVLGQVYWLNGLEGSAEDSVESLPRDDSATELDRLAARALLALCGASRLPAVPVVMRRSAQAALDRAIADVVRDLEAQGRWIEVADLWKTRARAAATLGGMKRAIPLFRRAARIYGRLGMLAVQADTLDDVVLYWDDARALPDARAATRIQTLVAAYAVSPEAQYEQRRRAREFGERWVRLAVASNRLGAALQAVAEVKAGEFLRASEARADLSRETLEVLERAASHTATAHRPGLSVGPAPLAEATRLSASPVGVQIGAKLFGDCPLSAEASIPSARTKRWLGVDEAAVEYFVHVRKQELLTLLIQRDSVRLLPVKRIRRRHAEAVHGLVGVTSGKFLHGNRDRLTTMLRDLHDLLVKPLRELPDRVRRLWLAPGGLLSSVPFAALADKDGRTLADRVAVRLVPTTAQLPRLPRLRRPILTAMVLRGDDTGEARLQHADAEVATVRSALEAAGTTLEQRIDVDALRNVDVVHFAGHARFDPSGASSALLLPGAPFSTEEFARLPLDDRPLVVLSACESAGVDSEADGVTGFVRAAFAAGARDVVCSGWVADDASTGALMESFYGRLTGGSEPADALRSAQLELRADPRWSDPFHWANFRLYGVG